jgi:hypothetical protein
MRQKKYSKDWNNNIETGQKKNVSSYLYPFREIEYSRDGENWFKSWNETFTEEQLENMKKKEEEEEMDEWYDYLENLADKYISESKQNYMETGELDFFAEAQLDRLAYEKYAEQFEINEDITEEEIDSDEYLDDEY